jgi:hypothetical protein
MTIVAQSSDGVEHEFPDETKPEVIDKVMKAYAREHTAKPTPLQTARNGQDWDKAPLSSNPIKAAVSGENQAIERLGLDWQTWFGGAKAGGKQSMDDAHTAADAGDRLFSLAPGSDIAELIQHPIGEATASAIKGPARAITPAVNAVGKPRTPDETARDLASTAGLGASMAALSKSPVAEVRSAKVGDKTVASALSALSKVGRTAANKAKAVAGDRDAAIHEAHQAVLDRIDKGAAAGGATAQDILDLAKVNPGKPFTIMDANSQPVKALAGRTYRQGGEAGQRIKNTLLDRTKGQGARMEADIKGAIARKAQQEAVAALQRSRAAAASPLYEAAFEANPAVRTPGIDAVIKTPAGSMAVRRAVTKMKNDMSGFVVRGGPPPDVEPGASLIVPGAPESRLGDPATQTSFNLRTLDYTKRALDDMISVSHRAGKADDVRILVGLKNKLVEELDAADKSGKYAQARAAYSGPTHSLEAVEFGKRALAPSSSPEEIAGAIRKMTIGDREFAKIGLADALRAKIGNKRITQNAAMELANTPTLQAKLRPFFKTQGDYEKFISSVAAEDTMFNTQYEVIGNSKTAEREAEDGGALRTAASVAKGAMHGAAGNHLGMLRHAGQALGDIAARPNPTTSAEISRIMTGNVNDTASIARKLLEAHAARTNRSPTNYLAHATRAVNPLVQHRGPSAAAVLPAAPIQQPPQ